MKNAVLVYILLAAFSIQLIPIKEVGSVLFGNEMIEEICHGADSDGKTADLNEDVKSKEFDYNKHTIDLTSFTSILLSSNAIEKHYASRLADDTPTRPPLAI